MKHLLIILFAISIASCKKVNPFCIHENGNVETINKSVKDFNAIELEGIGTVIYTQDEDYSVKVVASENIQKIIKVDVKNSKLRLGIKNRLCVLGNPEITFYVSSPEIEEFKVEGSGNIEIKNKFESHDLKMSVEGSGDIIANNLVVNYLETEISGSGTIIVKSDEEMNYLKADIAGSGDIDAINFYVKNAEINISGSGNCMVNVENQLDVEITGSGNVRYKGTPAIISEITGSGKISSY